jgi:hypothetical protein
LHAQVPVAGATNATLTITDAAPGIEGAYQVIITNYAGAATSRVASVSFSSAALAILTQPQSMTVAVNSPSTLTVLASGITPISYKWLKNSVEMPGETNNTLYFPSTSRTNGGTYRVVVTNPFLTLTSTNAVLSVVDPPLLSINFPSTSTIAVTVYGDPGRVHRLLSATNLAVDSVWVPKATNTIPGNGSATWNLPVSTNSGPVYYRAVTP